LSAEVIFIDDASQDQTGAVIDRILRCNPKRSFSKLTHAQNVGRGGAVADGFRAARGRFVGFIDVDLEIRPQCIQSCVLASNRGTTLPRQNASTRLNSARCIDKS
jgi:glycosyltransferase involved in cell wall biosynthesis